MVVLCVKVLPSDQEWIGGSWHEGAGGLAELVEVSREQLLHFTSYKVISLRLQFQQT